MSCDCICPEIDCSPVLSCINTDLLKIILENDPELTNFCEASVKCLDDQFELISTGGLSGLDFFPQAILKILSSLDGYSSSGDLFLSVSDGVFNWVSSSLSGSTYLDNGIGINVTGAGTSGDPFEPNLDTTYVRSLFTANNGLTYLAGNVRLGGTLNQNTTITGAGFNLVQTGLNQFTTFGTTVDIKGGLVANNYGQLILNSLQTLFFLIDGTDSYGLNFSSATQKAIFSSTQDLELQDGTDTDPNVVGTNKTFLKVANYHHANPGDTIGLVDETTGEIEWITPASVVAYTDEQAQDAVGNILTDSATIDFTYNDAVPTISAIVIDDSITFAKLQNITSDRLLGRDTATSGNTEELTVSGGIEFTGSGGIQVSAFTGDVTKTAGGTVLTIPNDSITDAKLRNSAGFSVIGKTATGTGDPADIVASTDQVLRRSGSGNLEFGSLVTNNIGDDQVTFAKVQNVNTSRILGRSTAGSGNIEELTLGDGLLLTGGVLSTFGRPLIGVTRFTSSDTWTKPVGCNAIIVLVQAGGGGGGGVSGDPSNAAASSGGGSGGFVMSYIASGIGSTETVTVGAGGAGGVAGNNNGSSGGTSSFGSLIVASGGSGGIGMAFGTTPALTAGSSSGGPTTTTGVVIASGGNYGGNGIRLSDSVAVGGFGGPGIYGGLIQPSTLSGNGATSIGRGSGGTGAVSNDGNDYAGGAGREGYVIVYEFS